MKVEIINIIDFLAKQLRTLYQIKNLKAPTKIDLGSKKQELPAVPEDNKFIQKNGKIFIENSHHDDDETDSFRDLFD